MKKLTRRQFAKVSIGAAGIAGIATTTGVAGMFAQSAFASTPRSHGVVLTSATKAELCDCISRGGYDTLKVITGWGLRDASMGDAGTISWLCNLTPTTIVRTAVGDGCGTDSNPYPDQVVAQISPWYQAKQNILIELGNEPNNKAWNGTDDAIWGWRYYLDQAIDACRKNFPNASIISPGLASGVGNPEHWFQIASDVMRKANYSGFHSYSFYSFSDGDWPNIVPIMQRYFGDVYWALTEYGINDTTQTSKATKGTRYAGLVHQGEGNPAMPWNVAYATYYHLATDGAVDPAYHIYPEGDDAYRSHAS